MNIFIRIVYRTSLITLLLEIEISSKINFLPKNYNHCTFSNFRTILIKT